MKILLKDGVKYRLHSYKTEEELDGIVTKCYKEIFGEDSLFFEKTKLTAISGIGAIPDGFVISPSQNKWYILEVELHTHDLFDHIVSQISKFSSAWENKNTQEKIIEFFDDEINNDNKKKTLLKSFIGDKEIHKFLTELIKKEPTIIVIIDEYGENVKSVCKKLPFQSKVIEFKTFVREGTENANKPVYIHLFEPLYKRKEKIEDEVVEGGNEDEEARWDSTRPLYKKLKERILNFSKDIVYKKCKGKNWNWWITFISKEDFCRVYPAKKYIYIYLPLKEGELNDPSKLATFYPNYYDLCGYEIVVEDDKNIDYIVDVLIKQAYDKKSK